MRLTRALLAAGILVAGGLTLAPRPYAAHAATPTLDPNMWKKLAALGSYHAESTLKWTGTGQKPGTMHWVEDVHGKDYHLILTSSTSSSQKSEMYYARGHFYIGESGHFVDLGDMGKQLAAPMLDMTLGYWTSLAQDGRNVRYIGRVNDDGRPAYRYTVQYGASVPGSGGSALSIASSYFTNTVDVDAATHAPLRVTGSYSGSDGQGHKSSLTTAFAVTRVGKVGAITVP